jgi:hypothetical protein
VTLSSYFTGHSEKVTNSTACMDGYVNGFKHWCQQNAKDCVDIVTKCGNGGCAPSIYINENKTAIKEASSGTPESRLLGTWNFVNKSSEVSGTMSFALTLVGGQDWSDQNFNQTTGGKTINLSPYCHSGCSTHLIQYAAFNPSGTEGTKSS